MNYFLSIFFGTFILEDIALASSLTLVAAHKLSMGSAFVACFLGICVGDIGLYGLGYAATRWNLPRQLAFLERKAKVFSASNNYRLFTCALLLCRFVPGTRLPSYFSAGFLRYPLLHFIAWTILSVLAWVGLAFFTGRALSGFIGTHMLMGLVGCLIILAMVKSTISLLSNPWDRKAMLYSWRKWGSFEFWPATLFYLPIVPYYVFLSLRYRSFLLPFYVNPTILHGGLIGESKYDFLKFLHRDSSHTLKTSLLQVSNYKNWRQILADEGWIFPFVLKPDIGQRGYGVRIIRSSEELEEYIAASEGANIVVQALSSLSREAGILYYRKPSEKMGSIFSITDKHFPSITADGKHSLGELILRDRRARVIANTYFARHQAKLDSIFTEGTRIQLSECGNHCQGAIFKNGSHLNSDLLLAKIDALAKSIPDFYFGRFDIKYKDEPSLRMGLNFEIVEINGAGSEATHIWDPTTKLSDAYSTLFQQWEILFAIGAEIKKQNRANLKIRVWPFLVESYRVFRRKEALSISS